MPQSFLFSLFYFCSLWSRCTFSISWDIWLSLTSETDVALCLRYQGQYFEWPKTTIRSLWLVLVQGGPPCYRELSLEASYLLLATSSAVPDSVSPALVKRGDCSRQRTWYQWVSGSVGAVDSHTVILQRGCKRSAVVRPRQLCWTISKD